MSSPGWRPAARTIDRSRPAAAWSASPFDCSGATGSLPRCCACASARASSPRRGRLRPALRRKTCSAKSIASLRSLPRSSFCLRMQAAGKLRSCHMDSKPLELSEAARAGCADRIGMARLAKMAFDGKDLRPIWAELIAKLLDGSAEAGEGLDLSLIAQLLGDKEAGLAIQHEVLLSHQLFRSPCVSRNPRLRVLALAAATDMGSNTPIEFLLEESGIELMMLYVIGERELPVPLPDHDVAIVIASDSEDCREALRTIDEAVSRWPRPLLNPPKRVGNLDRDKLHRLLGGVAGLRIPATIGAMREQLSLAAKSDEALADIAVELSFPVIVRPRG